MPKSRKPTLDLDAIREALKSAESMIAYYGENLAKKTAENAAMEAAGLPPLHKNLGWEGERLPHYERQAAALRAVLAHFEPSVAEAA